MKQLLTLVALATTLAAQAIAQQGTDDHSAHHPSATAPAGMTEGEVRKVDKDAQKLTIKHGEIKNLDMPPMTMVFRVKDAAMLDKLKAGDKIRFTAENSASGIVVTEIQPAQ